MFKFFTKKKNAPKLKHGQGWTFDVVGETNYQKAIEKIAGGKTEFAERHYEVACLIPEPTNSFDTNAVRVDIKKQTVGYIPKEHAKRFATFIAKETPKNHVYCDAVIVGGWKNEYGEGHFGVKLNVSKHLSLSQPA